MKKVQNGQYFTFVTLAKELGVSAKTIERDIRELGKDGMLKFVGSKRCGHYVLPLLKNLSKAQVKNVGKVSVKDVGEMSVRSKDKKERKSLIVEKVQNGQYFTFVTLAKELGVSAKTIERDIRELGKDDMLRFVGSKRYGYYILA